MACEICEKVNRYREEILKFCVKEWHLKPSAAVALHFKRKNSKSINFLGKAKWGVTLEIIK